MNVKWRPIRKSLVGETNFTVRFFTDILTEERMSLATDENGAVTQSRLDYLVQIPLDPRYVPKTIAELNTLVMHNCPYQWMIDEEKRVLAETNVTVDADLVDVMTLINSMTNETRTIVFPDQIKTNAEWRVLKKNQVAEKRDLLIQTGGFKLVVNGVTYWFHSNSISTCQQLGLISAAIIAKMQSAPDSTVLHPVPWRTMGGETISLTVGVALSILSASFAQQGLMFAAAESHKAAIDASSTARTYDVEVGWPEMFVPSV